MLTEGDVIEKLAKYLEKNDYEVLQKLKTSEKGIDIIAQKNEKILYVEAKGETSSRDGSRRRGLPFTKNQIKTHVGVAILASMKVLASKPEKTTRVAIALPDNKDHRDLIKLIESVLKKAGIDVYMVGDKSITKI